MDCSWLDELRQLNEPEHIRILQHTFRAPNVSQFLISTRPSVPPSTIAQRVKGRLQHLFQGNLSKPFRRNYSLRSIGSTRREKLEQYLATQLGHHRMADARVQDRLRRYQIHQRDVDLSQPRRTSHAEYWYNLHIVLVNEGRHMEIRDEILAAFRGMILRASVAKGHALLRAAIVPDHIHLALGGNLQESPEEIVLGYMNNLAHACGMRREFCWSYYVGTFSEYDLGVIPRA